MNHWLIKLICEMGLLRDAYDVFNDGEKCILMYVFDQHTKFIPAHISEKKLPNRLIMLNSQESLAKTWFNKNDIVRISRV